MQATQTMQQSLKHMMLVGSVKQTSFSLFIKLYFVYKVQGPSDQFFIVVVKDQGHDHLHHGDRDRGHGEVG